MNRNLTIGLLIAAVLFVVSMVMKGLSGEPAPGLVQGFLVTLSVFLTLCIFSFLYHDNPFYKFAEHLFVGVSAAYWMCQGFWSTIVGNLIPRISEGLSSFFKVPYQGGTLADFAYFIPIILGVLLLMRLSANQGWLARWPLAFIVGTTAGLNFIRYLRSDFIEQISATFMPLVVDWQGLGEFFTNFSFQANGQFALMVSNLIIFLGVFCGIAYFFFSKEHTGWFGGASRFGIWIMMITFGASFGYTVMGRISLLIGRITYLFRDWLGFIT